MKNRKAPASKMPAQFRLLGAALAFGAACMILSFADVRTASFTVPLSQSPALFAVCLTMLSFYGSKKSGKILSAAFVILATYFAFILALGEILALLPLAACAALTFCAASNFENKAFSKNAAVSAIAASLSSAVFTFVKNVPTLAGGEGEAYLGGLIASKLPYIGYIAFSLVPIIFFTAVLVHILSKDKEQS